LRRVIADHRAARGMVMAATHIDLGLDDVELLHLKLP
jgi:ABC-type transport system involved in cytochrome c biogenesis ATPase subunit